MATTNSLTLPLHFANMTPAEHALVSFLARYTGWHAYAVTYIVTACGLLDVLFTTNDLSYDGIMDENIAEMLAVGGKSNTLGKVNEVIAMVLLDRARLEELYQCLFDEDAWIRMRAADSIEKICREHPDWLLPYIDRFQEEVTQSNQPSILWHLAQIYAQVDLTNDQKYFATNWLKRLLSNKEVDWIVAANAMDTLVQFTREGSFPADEIVGLLKIQQHHRSNAVIKRANKYLTEF